MQYDSWCRNLFAALNEGGKWVVPRSGLVFRKAGSELVLHEKLAGTFPVSQADDLQSIKAHFAAAGITVRDHA